MRYACLLVFGLVWGCGSDDGGGGNVDTGGAGGGGNASGSGGSGNASNGGSGGSGNAAGSNGFETLPWEGGPGYYAKWPNGPSTDPSSFPIAVWLQSPSNASGYVDVGVNTFIGLWEGPTDEQLTDLEGAGLTTFCEQGGVWSSHVSDPTIRAWTHQDEPDNAQANGSGGYDPCIDPADIVAGYQGFVQNDASRPVYLNFGQGVSNTDWVGRGECTGKTEMYPEYAKGADIVSFDIYPVNEEDTKIHAKLEYVAKGIDLLQDAVNHAKPVWVWIETTDFNGTGNAPSVAQIESEVWIALIHGVRGFGYFAHVFEPTFIEAGLLADDSVKNGVKSINAQVQTLAPVLNTQSLANVVSVDSSVPVDVMAKVYDGKLYVFAVAMASGSTTATFTLSTPTTGDISVIGESRTLTATGASFSDDFSDYAVHRYELELP